MACNLKSISAASETCEEFFAGTGTNVYILPGAQFKASGKHVPDYKKDVAEFTDDAFDASNVTEVYTFPIASRTGQSTGTSNGKGKGFSNVMTGRVETGLDIWKANARTLNNMTYYYVLLETGKTKPGDDGETLTEYYVVGSNTHAMQFENSWDSGTDPDSDSGHTITFTQSPMKYQAPTWWGVLPEVTE